MAKGSKDEAYYWSSNHKEKSMFQTMKSFNDGGLLNGGLDIEEGTNVEPVIDEPATVTHIVKPDEKPEPVTRSAGQKNLFDFPEKGTTASKTEDIPLKVFVDKREMRSGVVKTLDKLGVDVVLETLEVGDYVVSNRVGIERKTAEDFLSTLMDGRDLFGQISDLARAFERPVLIIEGDGLYTTRQIHPNSIRGVLASIAIDFGIPIIFSKDEEDTAALVNVMAKREQVSSNREISLHGKKTSLTLKEQQEYVVSSISDIGAVVARNLLTHFGSVERIMTASRDELMEVPLVGPRTADRIREVIAGEYKG